MSKNLMVENTSPKNQTVVDVRPINSNPAFDFGSEQFYTIVTKRGQSMGLLLALTYSVAGTFTTSRSP